MRTLHALFALLRVFVRFARFSFLFGAIVPNNKNNALNAKLRIKFAYIKNFS